MIRYLVSYVPFHKVIEFLEKNIIDEFDKPLFDFSKSGQVFALKLFLYCFFSLGYCLLTLLFGKDLVYLLVVLPITFHLYMKISQEIKTEEKRENNE